MNQLKPALLALADGSIFKGVSIGAEGQAVGEVVFNTAMTGYQEILTDTSYREQIVTLTYPHIGNVGTNPEDAESNRVQLSGLILREVPRAQSSYRSTQDFGTYLQAHRVVAIAGIDTRRLTRILRDKGAQNGCIVAGTLDEKAALAAAQGYRGLQGLDLAKVVSTDRVYEWTEPTWIGPDERRAPVATRFHVVAYDFGIKRNIVRMLIDRGCRVTVVPAQTNAQDVLAMKPDGVLMSNGPGDPEVCDYAIAATRTFLEKKLPLYGICLGHQILGCAIGGKTRKMKFGHHGANHPVQDLETGRVLITSQNHGFEVDAATLPSNVVVTHRSLFDGSLQGIRLSDAPAFSFQGHPEASPGPQDVDYLFDRFIKLMESARG